MKLNYNTHIKLMLLALIFMSLGCDGYLSELPDNRTTIDSPDKISQLITGAYSEGNYQRMAEIMSDNSDRKTALNDDNRFETDLYNWDELTDFTTDLDSPNYFWNRSYEAIAQANAALDAITELQEKFDLDAQKGEALLARAYNHFMIANFWSKPYDPNTASADLGIPYVLESEEEFIKEYKRGTLQETYDYIESDLLEGLNKVENRYDSPKFHFTKEAGAAFAARFFLYKGDWDKVIKYASDAVSNPQVQLRDMVAYRPLTYNQNSLLYASKDEESNLLIASTSSVWAGRFIGTSYGLSVSKLEELFINGNPFLKPWAYVVYGTDQFFNLPKYVEYFRVTNPTANIGFSFVGVVLFDRDEVLLNRAEAYVMKEDYGSALNDLNVYLSKKTKNHDPATDVLTEIMVESQYPVVPNEYTPFYTMNAKQTSFVKFIAELRRREFVHEGLRWFDVRRFNLQVEHKITKFGAPLVLDKMDLRKVLKVPVTAINAGLEDNPR